MSNDTILRLAEIPNIVGVKEANGDIAREVDLINRAPEGFAVYPATILPAWPLCSVVATAWISVAANVAPKLFADMCDTALPGKLPSPSLKPTIDSALRCHVLRAQSGRAEMGVQRIGQMRLHRAPTHH